MPQPQSPPSTPAASPPPPEAKAPAPDPKKDAETRSRVAIEARLKTAAVDAVDKAKIIPPKAADPKVATPSSSKGGEAATGTQKPASTSGTPPSAASGTTTTAKDPGSESTEEAAEAQEARYSLKSVRNWARKNPEEAAEIAEQVFHVGKDQSAEWIRVQNKLRKGHEKLEEERTTFYAERDSVKQQAEETVGVLQPISDLFEAVNPNRGTDKPFDHTKIDFDAGDQAWLALTGVPIDDYMRHRARKGISVNPEMRALKLENERLKKAQTVEKKEEPKEEKKAPKEELPPALAKKWEAEVDEEHPIRQFVDWQKLLTKAMAPYYDADLDEYSKDPEKIATRLVQAKLDELEPAKVEEEKPVTRKPAASRPAGRSEEERPRARAKTDGELTTENAMRRVMRAPAPVETPRDMPKDIGARTQWAIQRAQKRAQGLEVE